MTRPTDLASSVWPELSGESWTLLVPLGATEQHGPHLPLDTDSRVAARVAADAVELLSPDLPVILAPTLAYGASGEHEGFPGTVSIGLDALELVLTEYGRSAARWASRVVFVNGHGGNGRAVIAAVERLRYEGREASWFACAFPGADAHAGRTETSLMLAMVPDHVRGERTPGAVEPIGELLPALRTGGVAAVSPNGVLGDPRGALAADGGTLLASSAADLAAAVQRWSPETNGRLR